MSFSIGIWWCILSNTLWVWFMFWRPQFKASSLPFNELLKGILSLKLSGWFNMRESETWLHYSLWHDGQDHVVDHWWSWPKEEEKPNIGMYGLYFFLHTCCWWALFIHSNNEFVIIWKSWIQLKNLIILFWKWMDLRLPWYHLILKKNASKLHFYIERPFCAVL